MLAILFEMTWTLSSCAAIPEAAMSSARMVVSPDLCLGRNGGELVERLGPLGALLLQDVGDLRIGAGDVDHARHFGDGAHVRLLDRALHDAHGLRRRLGRDAARSREQARSLLLQLAAVGEGNELELSARGVGGRARALADRDG